MLCCIPVEGQVSYQGTSPGFPIPLVAGGYHHSYNGDYPDADNPSNYDGEYGMTQSNEHMVWYKIDYPLPGWYHIRFDCQSPFRPIGTSEDRGAQFAIWRPVDLATSSVYDSTSPYYTTGGGFFNIYMSQEVYIFIEEPGTGLFSLDGYGHSIGKYYVSYQRVLVSAWGMVMPIPNPTYAPYNAESTIYLQ